MDDYVLLGGGVRRTTAGSIKPVRIPKLRKGELSKYGYSSKKSSAERQASLLEASKEYGMKSIIHKLTALYVLNKNKYPARAQIFRDDQQFLSEKYREYKQQKKASGKGVTTRAPRPHRTDPTARMRAIRHVLMGTRPMKR